MRGLDSRNFLPGRFHRQEYQVVLQDLGEQREVSAPDPLEVEPDSQDSVGHHTPGQGGSQGGGAQGFKEVGGGVQARDHSPDPSRPRRQQAQQQRGSASLPASNIKMMKEKIKIRFYVFLGDLWTVKHHPITRG